MRVDKDAGSDQGVVPNWGLGVVMLGHWDGMWFDRRAAFMRLGIGVGSGSGRGARYSSYLRPELLNKILCAAKF